MPYLYIIALEPLVEIGPAVGRHGRVWPLRGEGLAQQPQVFTVRCRDSCEHVVWRVPENFHGVEEGDGTRSNRNHDQ